MDTIKWLSTWGRGHRTTIIAVVTAALAFAEQMGWNIPPAVYGLLASFGLIAARAKYTDTPSAKHTPTT